MEKDYTIEVYLSKRQMLNYKVVFYNFNMQTQMDSFIEIYNCYAKLNSHPNATILFFQRDGARELPLAEYNMKELLRPIIEQWVPDYNLGGLVD